MKKARSVHAKALILLGALGSVTAFNSRVERIVHDHGKADGVLIGAALEWSQWNYSAENIEDTLGFQPKVYAVFVHSCSWVPTLGVYVLLFLSLQVCLIHRNSIHEWR